MTTAGSTTARTRVGRGPAAGQTLERVRRPRSTEKWARPPLEGVDWLASPDVAENACRHYLETLRWPEGISCPQCDGPRVTDIPARRRFYCGTCRHFFSLTSGTAFHNSHLPLWKWFLAIELVLDTDGGIPANELKNVLGGSYKTAWFVEHRIRAAICEARPGRRLVRREPGLGVERTYAAAVVGRYRQLGLKYLTAYRDEESWRARHRHNPGAFRDTVLALLQAEPLSLEELIASNLAIDAGRSEVPRRSSRATAASSSAMS